VEGVWGYNDESHTRTLDMHVAKLRKKVEDRPADPQRGLPLQRLSPTLSHD